MRLVISAVCLTLLSSNFLYAQLSQTRLWGTTSTNGQSSGYGSIYSVNTDGSDLQYVKKFESNVDGSLPFGSLTKTSTGQLFGVTSEGGINDLGVIFTMNLDGSGYTKVVDFTAEMGTAPKGNLIEASNGYLYGMTQGGHNDYGGIYRIGLDGNGFVQLHKFSYTDGAWPYGALLQASDGALYGVTSSGGDDNNGVGGIIFTIDLDGTNFRLLHKFDGITDQGSRVSLIEGQDGYLYGMTGTTGEGGIFKIAKDGTDYRKLHQFGTGQDGRQPQGPLIQLENGDLIGVAGYGGILDMGVLFQIKSDGTDYEHLYEFTSPVSGGIIKASDGRLYGTADPFNQGIIYTINTDGSDFNTVYANNDFNNGVAYRALVEAAPNVFIGVAEKGAASNNGAIFKVSSTGSYSKLKDFYQEGADPECALIQASDGDLYGVTTRGGAYGQGVIFKIKKDGTGYSKLFEFDMVQGMESKGGLVELPDGYLCGITKRGGNEYSGNIYKIKLDGTDFSTIKSFTFSEGNPFGSIVLGADGYLYGVTFKEFPVSPGMLYKILPDGTSFSIVLDFNAVSTAVGTQPIGIRFGSDGYLYGVTSQGGLHSSGTIFRVKNNGAELQKLADLDFSYFSLASGNVPIHASNGLLYGTGFFNHSVYSLDPGSLEFNAYHHPQGTNSMGDLIELSEGFLFGTNVGNIFRFDLTTKSLVNLFDANPFNAGMPHAGLLPIQKELQALTFETITEKTFGDGDFELSASSTLGLPITFHTSNPEVATVNGDMLTITGSGSATITARQAGTIVIASVEKEQLLVVNKSNQSITLDPVPFKTVGDGPFTLPATSSSGQTIEYLAVYGKVEITDNVVTPISPGREIIKASVSANENYNASPSVERSFCIKPAKPAISMQASGTAVLLSSSNDFGNQWYLNGTLIEGATTQTLSGLTTGNYSVSTTVDDCVSEWSDEYSFVVTSSEEVDFSERITIFPNPATEKVVVNVEHSGMQQLDIRLIDPMGRNYDVIGTMQGHDYIADVKGLPAGLYIFKIIVDNKAYYASFIKP